MLFNLVLAFSLTRLFLSPKTKAHVATYELFGCLFIAANAVRTISSNPWVLAIRDERHAGFDFHCVLETAWYISLLPHCDSMAMFAHHALSATLALYGLYMKVTYLGFMALSIMVWSSLLLAASRMLHHSGSRLAKPSFAVYFVTRIAVLPLMLFRVWPACTRSS